MVTKCDKEGKSLPKSKQKSDSVPKRESVFSIRRLSDFFQKKIENIRRNSGYVETLSFHALRRSVRRSMKVNLRERNARYNQLITEEEQRYVALWYCNLINR